MSDRLASLEKYKAFLAICGRWKAPTKNTYWQTKQQGRSQYWYWENSGSSYDGVIDVYCTINDDGTVTIHGEAGFTRYTNYSDYSSNLKTTTKHESFSLTVKSLSKSNKLKKTSTVSIVYYEGPKFKLDYSYTDNTTDVYWKYVYTSKYTYTDLVNVY